MSSATAVIISPVVLNELSRQWVDELLGSLLEQGRPAEGGWPGTVSEARVRIRDYASAGELDLSSPESTRLARALNQDARSRWRVCSRRSTSDLAFTGDL